MTDKKEAAKTDNAAMSASPVECGVSIFNGLSDRESCELQLKLWIKGEPHHNPIRDECCPDFSCCNGNIATETERVRFGKACAENDDHVKMEMLGMFLGNAFAKQKIYIAGTTIPSEC